MKEGEVLNLFNREFATPFTDVMHVENWSTYIAIDNFRIKKDIQSGALSSLYHALASTDITVDFKLKNCYDVETSEFLDKLYECKEPLSIGIQNYKFEKCLITSCSFEDNHNYRSVTLNIICDHYTHTPYPLDIKELVNFGYAKKKKPKVKYDIPDDEFSDLFDKLL